MSAHSNELSACYFVISAHSNAVSASSNKDFEHSNENSEAILSGLPLWKKKWSFPKA